MNASLAARMGLFVVGRLAARYGIRCGWGGSFYGGITAMVLLPTEILVAADNPRRRAWRRAGLSRPRWPSGLVRTVGGAGPTP